MQTQAPTTMPQPHIIRAAVDGCSIGDVVGDQNGFFLGVVTDENEQEITIFGQHGESNVQVRMDTMVIPRQNALTVIGRVDTIANHRDALMSVRRIPRFLRFWRDRPIRQRVLSGTEEFLARYMYQRETWWWCMNLTDQQLWFYISSVDPYTFPYVDRVSVSLDVMRDSLTHAQHDQTEIDGILSTPRPWVVRGRGLLPATLVLDARETRESVG